MVTTEEKRKIGKKSRASGAAFELRVRKDLEKKGWIVDKWSNNVEFKDYNPGEHESGGVGRLGKLSPAKHKFRGIGIPMALGTGMPDFIAFKQVDITKNNNFAIFEDQFSIKADRAIMGVEVKSAKYLDRVEKEKCQWLLENKIFSKILIAYKGPKRGQILYKEFNQSKGGKTNE